MTNHTTPHRSRITLGITVGAATIGLLGAAAPARAQEFEPIPHLSLSSFCDPPGGRISTLMSNTGNADAHFRYIVGGGAPASAEDIVVVPGGVVERIILVPEDQRASTLTTSLDDPTVQIGQAFSGDCEPNPFLRVEVDCGADGPSATAVFGNTSVIPVEAVLEVGDQAAFEGTLVAGDGTHTLSLDVVEDGPAVDLALHLRSLPTLTAQVAGQDCLADAPSSTEPPVTTTSVPATEPTVTSPPTTSASPTGGGDASPSSTSTAPTDGSTVDPSAANEAPVGGLPATGSRTDGILSIGLGLVGVGAVLVAGVRRSYRS